MKTYKSIEETIAEVRKKDKRYNYIVLFVMVLMIAFIVTVILYDRQIREYKAQMDAYEITLDNYKTLQKNYELVIEENEKTKRIYNDSISLLVKNLRQELSTIGSELDNQNSANTKIVQSNIDLAQDKLNRITNNISDHTIVRYYKRSADGDKIEDLIENMKDPAFRLNIYDVKDDNGRVTVNTLWFGSEVNRVEVSKLLEALKAINVRIPNVKEFTNPKTKEWKKAAIEIGYEPVQSSTKASLTRRQVAKLRANNKNIKYNIRFYSYKPNEETKERLAQFIKKENFSIKVYPDWEEKYSFFADVPTIFYYDREVKDVAEKLAETLAKNVGVVFKVQLGNGYGIKREEKKDTFIIHYTE